MDNLAVIVSLIIHSFTCTWKPSSVDAWMDAHLFFHCSYHFPCNPAVTAVLILPNGSASLSGSTIDSPATDCNLRKSWCNPSLHFLLNFHRKPAIVLPPRLFIVTNPTVQHCSHWIVIGFPCSVSYSTVLLMLIRWFDRNTTIKLTFIQLRFYPYPQLFSQMCKITSVNCCLIVLAPLCFRYQLSINSSWTCPILQSVHSAHSCTYICLISHLCCIAELLVHTSCL